VPESVFRGIVNKWNRYSGVDLLPGILELLHPQRFDLKTRVIAGGYDKTVGCIGRITYKILGEVDALAIRQLNALANYAFYAGIGRKTTMGRGMARRVVS